MPLQNRGQLTCTSPGQCPGGIGTRKTPHPTRTHKSHHICGFSSPSLKEKYTVTHFKFSTQTTLGNVNCPLTHIICLCPDHRTKNHGDIPSKHINKPPKCLKQKLADLTANSNDGVHAGSLQALPRTGVGLMLRTPPWPAGSLFQLSRGPPALSSDLPWRPPDWLFSGVGAAAILPGSAWLSAPLQPARVRPEASREVSRESGRRLWQGWGQPPW